MWSPCTDWNHGIDPTYLTREKLECCFPYLTSLGLSHVNPSKNLQGLAQATPSGMESTNEQLTLSSEDNFSFLKAPLCETGERTHLVVFHCLFLLSQQSFIFLCWQKHEPHHPVSPNFDSICSAYSRKFDMFSLNLLFLCIV